MRKKRTEYERNKADRIKRLRSLGEKGIDYRFQERRRRLRVIGEFQSGRLQSERPAIFDEYEEAKRSELGSTKSSVVRPGVDTSREALLETMAKEGHVDIFSCRVAHESLLVDEIEAALGAKGIHPNQPWPEDDDGVNGGAAAANKARVVASGSNYASQIGPGMVAVVTDDSGPGAPTDPIFAYGSFPSSTPVRGATISAVAEQASDQIIIPFLDTLGDDEPWSLECKSVAELSLAGTGGSGSAALARRASLIQAKIETRLKKVRRRAMRRRVSRADLTSSASSAETAGVVTVILTAMDTAAVSVDTLPLPASPGSDSGWWWTGAALELGERPTLAHATRLIENTRYGGVSSAVGDIELQPSDPALSLSPEQERRIRVSAAEIAQKSMVRWGAGLPDVCIAGVTMQREIIVCPCQVGGAPADDLWVVPGPIPSIDGARAVIGALFAPEEPSENDGSSDEVEEDLSFPHRVLLSLNLKVDEDGDVWQDLAAVSRDATEFVGYGVRFRSAEWPPGRPGRTHSLEPGTKFRVYAIAERLFDLDQVYDEDEMSDFDDIDYDDERLSAAPN